MSSRTRVKNISLPLDVWERLQALPDGEASPLIAMLLRRRFGMAPPRPRYFVSPLLDEMLGDHFEHLFDALDSDAHDG